MSSRRSSGNVVGFMGTSARSLAASRADFAARARSRRMRSVARFRAVVISQVRGLLGARRRVAIDRWRWRTPPGGGFLGEVDVAEEADQGGQDPAPLLAEDPIERRYQYTSEGRISTAPPWRAAGTRAATSMAASR